VPRALGIALVLAAVLVAAGCGVRNSKPFNAQPSAGCLKSHGFTGVTTNPLSVGFIAAFADRGGLRARSPSGNLLTIAFTADANSTGDTQDSFRAHAPPKLRPHMSDIMETNRNAVLVWTTTPDPGELDTATRCLKP
jgi:hypothetical protein